MNQELWFSPVVLIVLILGRWRQEDQVKVILGYIVNSRPAWDTSDLERKREKEVKDQNVSS